MRVFVVEGGGVAIPHLGFCYRGLHFGFEVAIPKMLIASGIWRGGRSGSERFWLFWFDSNITRLETQWRWAREIGNSG